MTRSAVAYWVGKFNAEAALLTTQQSATTTEHNARYVNGIGTGQLWIDKDAADVAAAASAASTAAAALAAMTTDRNNQAAALATMTTDRNAQAAAAATNLANYNAEVATYNALLAGLTDQVTSVAINLTVTENNSYGPVTLTIPKNGHYEISIVMVADGSWHSSGGDPGLTISVGGAVGDGPRTLKGTNGSGTQGCNLNYGFQTHGNFTAGQQINFFVGSWRTNVTISGVIIAHWVPTSANPS